MANKVLITAQTAAVTTKASFIATKGRIPATLSAPGLAGAEEVPVFLSVDGGTTWLPLYKDGIALKLTATKTAVTIYGPIQIGVTKPITVAAVGVYVQHNDKVEGEA